MKLKGFYVLIFIGCLLFAFLVWPTLYRYDKVNEKWPVRINRITGYTEMLTQNGWSTLNSSTQNQQEALKSKEITKQSQLITVGMRSAQVGDFTVDRVNVNGNTLSGELTNSSNHTILLDSIKVETYDMSGNVLSNQPLPSMVYGTTLEPNDSKAFSAVTIVRVGDLPPLIGAYKITVSYTIKD